MNRNKLLGYLLDFEKQLFSKNKYLNLITEALILIAALLPVFILAGNLIPRITTGSFDLRYVEVMPLGRDEAYVATTFWSSWERGVPLFGSIYGSLYYNIAFVIAKFIDFFSPVTQSTVIVLLRCISFFSYLFSALTLYIVFRKNGGLFVAISVTLIFSLLSYNDDFVRRITICQPDMLNLFCGILVLSGAIKAYNRLDVVALIFIAVFSGLFMSVKHSGFIFFPLVFLIFVSAVYSKGDDEIKELKASVYRLFFKIHFVLVVISALLLLFFTFIKRTASHEILLIVKTGSIYFLFLFLMLFILELLFKKSFFGKYTKFFTTGLLLFLFLDVFILTFSVCSIGSVYPNLSFLSNLSRLNSFFSTVSGSLVNWWEMIIERIINYWYVIVLALGLLFVLKNPHRNLTKKEKQLYLLVLCWLLGSVLIIMSSVGLIADRYLFPFFPFFLFVLVMPVFFFLRFVALRVNMASDFMIHVTIAILYLLFLVPSLSNLKTVKLENTLYFKTDLKPGVQVGEWLKANCRDNSKILIDAYVYVPSSFSNLKMLDYGDPFVQFRNFEPDIIILNDYYKKLYDSTPEEEISPANLIKTKISKSFYSYFDQNPEYELWKVFRNDELNEGFRVFRKRSL